MKTNPLLALTAIVLAFSIVMFGCSDNNNPSGSDGDANRLNMVDVAEIIRAVTPPVFEAPSAAPASDSFEVWTQGDWPLLEMVFGDNEPQTLDQNLYEFEFYTGAIGDIMRVDDEGVLITGTYIDSVVRLEEGQDSTYHGTFEVSTLSQPSVIPAANQGILGTSYDLDYLIDITIDEVPGGKVKVGFKLDSTVQTLLVYLSNMDGQPNRNSSSLVYSTLDLRDSTFVFKGVMYSADLYETFAVAYIVTSETAGEFGYRSSWVFEDEEPPPMLSSIIGGGNKDVEFALKFRFWNPADAPEPVPDWSFDQVFGPNYTEGTGLLSSFSEYLDDNLLIELEHVPAAMLADPWAE